MARVKTCARKTPPTAVRFTRPELLPENVQKYYRCLSAVAAKAKPGQESLPYAVCSKLRPARMPRYGPIVYDYDNMPYSSKRTKTTSEASRNIADAVKRIKKKSSLKPRTKKTRSRR